MENQNQGSSLVYRCFICNSLEHKIYDYPHKLTTQYMFQDKVSHIEPKKDKAAIIMVLAITTKSHNLGLVSLWEKEKLLQKIFESVI